MLILSVWAVSVIISRESVTVRGHFLHYSDGWRLRIAITREQKPAVANMHVCISKYLVAKPPTPLSNAL